MAFTPWDTVVSRVGKEHKHHISHSLTLADIVVHGPAPPHGTLSYGTEVQKSREIIGRDFIFAFGENFFFSERGNFFYL